jgi:hypothetical protein
VVLAGVVPSVFNLARVARVPVLDEYDLAAETFFHLGFDFRQVAYCHEIVVCHFFFTFLPKKPLYIISYWGVLRQSNRGVSGDVTLR